MRFASIRSLDISNGEDIGVSLFTQGCNKHCKNCFNPETWDFNGGALWTVETCMLFLDLVDRPYIKRVSFLGGEPLAEENSPELYSLIEGIKTDFPDKQIWIYTGLEWEDCVTNPIMKYTDVLVAGPYIDELKDVGNRVTRWAGSTNQRIIDVQKTLATGTICEYKPQE